MGREVRRSGVGTREEGRSEGQKRDSEAEDSQGRGAYGWGRESEVQSEKRREVGRREEEASGGV